MTKKLLSLMAALLMLAITTAASAEELPVGYYNIAEPYRYLTFATDGGSYIKAVEVPTGTTVNADAYIPVKDGYIFDGWYADPRTKEQRITEITLNENIAVYAKWIDDGTPKPQAETHKYASNEEILAYGNHIDEKTGVPVTALWVQQNAMLQELMEMYHQKFNQ